MSTSQDPAPIHPDRDSAERLSADGVFVHEFFVSASAIDENGHVNNVQYVQWMQDVAVRHVTASSSVDGMGGEAGIWVARSHSIEYLRPAFAGDRIQASTWIADLRRVRARRRYRFVRRSDGAVLAEGETDWVFVNPATGRPRSIPEEIKAAFSVAPTNDSR